MTRALITSLLPPLGNEDYTSKRDVSFQSVRFDVRSVTDKLGIPTKAQLILYLPVPMSLLFLHNPVSETWITLGSHWDNFAQEKELWGSHILPQYIEFTHMD